MIPFFAMILNLSMFTVAIPAIRADFSLAADTASWVVLAYSIPYVVFMPFHGRLGDILGPRRLIWIGLIVYASGTVICALAPGLSLLSLGRIVQGAGAASINPLSLTILTREVNLAERGRAMGTWNMAGPLTGILGPLLAGFLIDSFSWRAIYLPVLAAQMLAAGALMGLVPHDPPEDPSQESERRRSLREFDWPGLILTALTLLSFVLFLSSRPVTGRDPFTDWRLGVLFAAMASLWYLWERGRPFPFVPISLFRRPQFAIAAGSVSARMLLMASVSFLVPLFAADVLMIPATEIGLVLTLHAAALLLTMRFGGRLADRWNRRWAVLLGLGGQTLTLLFLGLIPVGRGAGLIAPISLHGAFAGLSLASLHHVALNEIPEQTRGVGAGTYSMSRFVGSLLGATVMGVVLEQSLAGAALVSDAYRTSFLVASALGLLGVLPALGIRHGSNDRA